MLPLPHGLGTEIATFSFLNETCRCCGPCGVVGDAASVVQAQRQIHRAITLADRCRAFFRAAQVDDVRRRGPEDQPEGGLSPPFL